LSFHHRMLQIIVSRNKRLRSHQRSHPYRAR